MSPDPELYGAVKRKIGVVRWRIHSVHQSRTDLRPSGDNSMTGRASRFEKTRTANKCVRSFQRVQSCSQVCGAGRVPPVPPRPALHIATSNQGAKHEKPACEAEANGLER